MTVTPVRTELTGLEALIEWLDETPLKYEIIDGQVVVSPPPASLHEDATGSLYVQLRAQCPEHLLVQTRYGWSYDPLRPKSFLEPDLGVVLRDRINLRASTHDEPPLLAVETRSQSTWRNDEGLKRDIYAEGGVGSYWLLDPETPRLRVLELVNGTYVEAAVAGPEEELALQRPFPLRLRLPEHQPAAGPPPS